MIDGVGRRICDYAMQLYFIPGYQSNSMPPWAGWWSLLIKYHRLIFLNENIWLFTTVLLRIIFYNILNDIVEPAWSQICNITSSSPILPLFSDAITRRRRVKIGCMVVYEGSKSQQYLLSIVFFLQYGYFLFDLLQWLWPTELGNQP